MYFKTRDLELTCPTDPSQNKMLNDRLDIYYIWDIYIYLKTISATAVIYNLKQRPVTAFVSCVTGSSRCVS